MSNLDIFVDAQRRFQVVESPVNPGTCRVCGAYKGVQGVEYFVDLGFSDEQGVVYLCNRCAKEMANILGYFSRTNKMDNMVLDLERRVHEYDFQFSVLRDAGIDIDRLLSCIPNDPWEGSSVPERKRPVERKGTHALESDHGEGSNDARTTGLFTISDGN